MSILQFQFFDSYSRMLVNGGEVFSTGPPGCSNPLPGRPEELCHDGQGDDAHPIGLEICPDRHFSLIPPQQMRSDGAQWQQTAFGASPPAPIASDTSVHEIMLSNTLPDKALDQFACQIEEIAFGNGYQGSQHPITPAGFGGPTGFFPTLPVNNDFTNAAPAVGFMEGTSLRLTASGGNIADWRYIILYINSQPNPTHVHDGPLVGFWDHGVPVTITDGQTHAFKFDLAPLDAVGNILKVTRIQDPI